MTRKIGALCFLVVLGALRGACPVSAQLAPECPPISATGGGWVCPQMEGSACDSGFECQDPVMDATIRAQHERQNSGGSISCEAKGDNNNRCVIVFDDLSSDTAEEAYLELGIMFKSGSGWGNGRINTFNLHAIGCDATWKLIDNGAEGGGIFDSGSKFMWQPKITGDDYIPGVSWRCIMQQGANQSECAMGLDWTHGGDTSGGCVSRYQFKDGIPCDKCAPQTGCTTTPPVCDCSVEAPDGIRPEAGKELKFDVTSAYNSPCIRNQTERAVAFLIENDEDDSGTGTLRFASREYPERRKCFCPRCNSSSCGEPDIDNSCKTRCLRSTDVTGCSEDPLDLEFCECCVGPQVTPAPGDYDICSDCTKVPNNKKWKDFASAAPPLNGPRLEVKFAP